MATPALAIKPYIPNITICEERPPASSIETRQRLATILATQVDEFTSRKAAALNKHRAIQVEPKDLDLQSLNAKLQERFNHLFMLSSASSLPINRTDDTLQRLHSALLLTSHDMRSPDGYDTPLPPIVAQNLASCKEMQDIVEANLKAIEKSLNHLSLSKENPSLSFRAGFAEIAHTIAISPIDSKESHYLLKGSFGTTELVVHENKDRYVKKKPSNSTDTNIRDAFDNETAISYSLPDHSGIVKFYGVDKEGHLLLSYIPDKDLADAIINDTLGMAQKYIAAERSAKALAFLHSIGLIHCDIKPDNIMLDVEQPILIDFGFARSKFIDSDKTSFIGTANYRAPEMFSSKLSKDGKIDVWSYGCSLYSLLTGTIFWPDVHKALGKQCDTKITFDFLKENQVAIQNIIPKLLEAAKRHLKTQGFPEPQLNTLFKVLNACLQANPKKRAEMENIVAIFNS